MTNLHRLLILTLLLLISVSVYAQEKTQIVASHSILADVVNNVTGDVADVSLTMPVGADPHSFEALPSDLTALAEADVVFVNGAFFEEGLMDAIENAGADMNIVEVSSCVEIIEIGINAHDHSHGGDEHDEDGEHGDDEHSQDDNDHHDEGDEHDHDEEIKELCEQHIAEFNQSEHSDDDHSHDEDEEHSHEGEHANESLGRLYELDCREVVCDPHVWMDVHNVMYWTMMIRDTLVMLDPDNADTYRANADGYLMALDELVHDVVNPLVESLPEENRILITSHDSLGYLATTYDFELIGTIIPGGSTIAEPSAQEIAELSDLIDEEGVPAIFGETTVNDAIAQTIADETGAELVVLYSGSLSDESDSASTYLDYIKYNYTTIVEALTN